MEWLTLVNTCLTIILTGVCSFTTWYLQKKFNDKSVAGEGVRTLLRRELREIYRQASARGSISLDELEEVTIIYEIYHTKLGGNGTGTKLYEDIKRLPIDEKEV